ncbi:DNA end-binding protein Ku [Pseudoxanthobacter soli DSM 19599]|uniref:Non-homologous end joining protein Ku n=1 Tax=Pseudoxanthobacter soli DSM 19599 TaxID=1123029 RepID=A0A1M7ZPM4_9HYPH|nr:Ku protein [Pseudoxanthobacter soli]SHO66845.1 DNA end-binding protein Ku [Pseudoxanthobacter soli DSM 19599]
MAQRVFWKGYLKLSLVTCPVAMTPATSESNKVRFHTLNRRTGNRVVSRYLDAGTGKPVDEDDEVKGYPRGEDDYVMLEDEELEAVALESTRTIDIERFAPADSIGWIWYDTPHYLSPSDKVGTEAFSVIRDAMAATGTVGISRLVLYRREHAVLIEPRDRGMVLWTLRAGDEVRDEAVYFDRLDADQPDEDGIDLVTALIDARTRLWDPKMVHDPVQDRLLDIIAAKRDVGKRRAAPREAAPERPAGDVNIMEALRRSLAAETGSNKPGAAAPAKKAARGGDRRAAGRRR